MILIFQDSNKELLQLGDQNKFKEIHDRFTNYNKNGNCSQNKDQIMVKQKT
jgi:hypothetical protein